MMNILIVGYGNMGQGYGKTLSHLNIPFDYHDPPKNKIVNNLKQFTHLIITTPCQDHINSFNKFKHYFQNKNILIIKPVFYEKINEIKKPIFYGMIERYNPIFLSIKNKIINSQFIKFKRYNNKKTEISPLVDLGIHDIDLMCECFSKPKIKYISIKNKSYFLEFNYNDKEIVIEGGESQKCERIITIDEGIYDLTQVNKKEIYCQQIKDFLANKNCNARKSHNLLVQLRNLEINFLTTSPSTGA